jgi:L-ascorbate metabolism protein UlaG (beta-lactamase superfamily)
MTVRHDGLTVDWFGYATARIASDDTVVYLDPGRYGVLTGDWEPDSADAGHPPARDYAPHDADLVCVTHNHHYDSDGIQRVSNDDTTVLVYEGVNVAEIDREVVPVDELPHDVVRVSDDDQLVAADVPLWTVEAYNDPDGPRTTADGKPFHPPGFGCGYLLDVDGSIVFWPGDSDVLDGHAELDVSLFLPSISGSFTMDRHEAAELAGEMDPDLVVPIHYNTFEALEADSGAFAADVAKRSVPVALDEN